MDKLVELKQEAFRQSKRRRAEMPFLAELFVEAMEMDDGVPMMAFGTEAFCVPASLGL